MQLPRWRCHKEVSAFMIGTITAGEKDGCFKICEMDNPGLHVTVSPEFIQKHGPKPGGFYVRYDDGYESFSPNKPFLEGYSRITIDPGNG